ncbi:MAG: Hsp20/alpha crystallin family protein [Candidatus Thermoplasmatota archaeon]|nr:Hsp20/alpha crystallin family protein [Candidatus Thermoplasmatota archaeon]
MIDDKDEERDNPFNDEEFQRILHEMERLVEDAFKTSLEEWKSGKTFVKGFAVRMGPDGEPQIDEFTHDAADEEEVETDVIEGIDSVAVTLSLPFMAHPEDIDVYVDRQTLEIAIDDPERTMYRALALPCPVRENSLCYTYKNRVLDVELQKQDDQY